MRKIVLVFILITVSKIVSAQTSGIGFKVGVNFANMSLKSNYDIDTKSKTGLHIGLFYNFVLSEKLTLRPELLYSVQGCKYDQSNIDASVNANYFTVPVVVKYKFTDMISLHGGPQFGFLTKIELEVSGDKQDMKDDFQGADVGAMVGLEIDLSVVGFGARYYRGLMDIQVGDAYDDVRNTNIQFYVTYTLNH
jgi:hypothetical protein